MVELTHLVAIATQAKIASDASRLKEEQKLNMDLVHQRHVKENATGPKKSATKRLTLRQKSSKT